ncbi:MAG: PqqD family peptide modification chaperone [Clostridia bacterium]
MKLNGRYRLRKVGDTYIVVKLGGGQAVNFSQLITVNETGAFIFNKLEKEISMDELVCAIMEEYDIDEDRARNAAETYVGKLAELGIAER